MLSHCYLAPLAWRSSKTSEGTGLPSQEIALAYRPPAAPTQALGLQPVIDDTQQACQGKQANQAMADERRRDGNIHYRTSHVDTLGSLDPTSATATS